MRNLLYLILVACLPATSVSAQTAAYNFDFENWHTDSSGQDRLDLWEHVDNNGDNRPQLHGTQKSTQSYTGSYAVTIHRWYMVDKDRLKVRGAISTKPAFLNGFYKYTDVVLNLFDDTAAVTLYFTKWNNVTNRADTIGYGYRELAASPGYTPFSCNITYMNASQPDSFSVHLTPSKFSLGAMCKDSPDCSFFTIDNLSFSNVTGVNNADERKRRLHIYPNPAADFIILEDSPPSLTVKIYNSLGTFLSERNAVNGKLDVGNLPPGCYWIIGVNRDKLLRGNFIKR